MTAGPVTALAAASALSRRGPPCADTLGAPDRRQRRPPPRVLDCPLVADAWIVGSVRHRTPHGCSSLPGAATPCLTGGAARGGHAVTVPAPLAGHLNQWVERG